MDPEQKDSPKPIDDEGPVPPKDPPPSPPTPPPPPPPSVPQTPPPLEQSRERASPKSILKVSTVTPVQQQPRNISPIPEGSKSTDSTAPQQRSSTVSDATDAFCTNRFKPKLMIAVFSVHWIASLAIFVIGLVLSLVPPSVHHGCHVYFVVVYLRIVFWIATYILHELIKPPCLRLVNQNFNLYRDLKWYRKTPLKIVSIWNVILIVVQGYVRSLFGTKDSKADVCSGLDGSLWIGHEISPQLFVTIFSGLETITLGVFYALAIKRLWRALQPQEEEEDESNRTLANQDEIPINQRLMRQAEQVKILTASKIKLRAMAIYLGALDENE